MAPSITTLTKPSVSPIGARLADLAHELDVHVCASMPRSRASASVKPTAATSGSVNVTRGMAM